LKLLSASDIRAIDQHLRRLLERTFNPDNGLAPVNEVIRRYVLSGGKRIRPQLCVWTFLNAAEDATSGAAALPTSMLDLACAWELFHAFLLAHDDIIDNADTRRDRPSLHRQLASLDGDTKQFGVNLGIVAGDLMFSGAMRLWHEIDLPADVYRQELRLFSRIACTTGFGQAIDICQSHGELDAVDETLLLREYHWKTAAYTFEGPMLSAAILARLDDAAQVAISRFALALGQAYQLQNDLLDLSGPAQKGGDLVQGKRTVTLIRARSLLPPPRRADFDRRLSQLRGANGEAVVLAEALRSELRDSGAIEQTQALIDEFVRKAQAAAQDPAMPARLAGAMIALMESLRSQYFTPVSI
jgi:geranylgeranyl diphosphate synthase type I